MSVHEKHIEMVEAVNDAETEIEHREADLRLAGFRTALETLYPNGFGLLECDMHYLSQGIDRPMCCGVFLDWQPTT